MASEAQAYIMTADPEKFASTMRRLDGDAELFRDLVRFFFEDYPGLLAQLRRGVSNRDGESVERAAHRIRGLVSNFDDQRPTEAARRLETSGHSRNFDDAVSDLAELEKGIAYLSGALTPFRGPAR